MIGLSMRLYYFKDACSMAQIKANLESRAYVVVNTLHAMPYLVRPKGEDESPANTVIYPESDEIQIENIFSRIER